MATTFAERIKKAATDFSGAHSTAWVQYKVVGGTDVTVRMQAPEIMKEFEGDVEFGTDPKGILFFRDRGDLDIIGQIQIKNYKHSVSGSASHVVVETEFAPPGSTFTPFARFVAEVDTRIYPIPQFNPRAGTGILRTFDAVTCHVQVNRTTGSDVINMGTNSIHKQAFFSSLSTEQFSHSGILFFRVLSRLKTKPNGREFCVANYNRDRIVFHIENGPNEVVALFIPNTPITNIGQAPQTPRVEWQDIPTQAFAFVGAAEGEGEGAEASA